MRLGVVWGSVCKCCCCCFNSEVIGRLQISKGIRKVILHSNMINSIQCCHICTITWFGDVGLYRVLSHHRTGVIYSVEEEKIAQGPF